MLECYFDDSGTHAGAPVVVWGGLIGEAQSFAELDAAWQQRLREPVPGKPALKKGFHLYDCVHGRREFDGYNQGARDLARNLFRTAIIEAGVGVVACGVDVKEWDRQVTGDLRALVGGAEGSAFGQCVKVAMDAAQSENEQINAYFDAAREAYVLNILAGARLLYPEVEQMTRASFAPVGSLTGLQAADTAAYESYRLLRSVLDNPDAQLEPHMRHLSDNAFSTTVMLMRREEIAALVEKMQPTVEEFRRTGTVSGTD